MGSFHKTTFASSPSTLIFKIRSCAVRSDLKNKVFSADFCFFLRSDLRAQDRILKIRVLASLGLQALQTSHFSMFRDKKSMGMAMFKQKFARTIPDNLRAPHMKMWGFEAKKGQKVHPNLAPNITMEFHYHVFFFPDMFFRKQNFSVRGYRSETYPLGRLHYTRSLNTLK